MPVAVVLAAAAVVLFPATSVCLCAGVSACVWLFLRGRTLRSRLAVAAEWQEAAASGWRDLSPVAFEKRCAEILRMAGWSAATTKASGDQGIDVLARRDGQTLVLQCKLYSSTVGNKAVQQVIAGRAFVAARHAAVVSNAKFSPSARELATRTGVLLLHCSELGAVNARLGLPAPPQDAGGGTGRLSARVEANRKALGRTNAAVMALVALAFLYDTTILAGTPGQPATAERLQPRPAARADAVPLRRPEHPARRANRRFSELGAPASR